MKKTVIITGAAGGIGSMLASQFGKEGYTVILSDINREGVYALERSLTESGVTASAFSGTLEETSYWEELILHALAVSGRIDVLVNNAVWRIPGSLRSTSLEIWEKTIKICLTAPVFLTKGVAAVMERQGEGGVIINLSSVTAHRPSGLGAAYIAAKGALESLTREFAVTYGRRGIRVICVAPGYIETTLSRDFVDKDGANVSDELIRRLTDFIPQGRGGTPIEIADTVVWLCSDKASYISGTTITVDGGFQPNFSSYSDKHIQSSEEF